MTVFITTITNMYTLPKLEGQVDVVVNVLFNVSGIDGQYSGEIGNSQEFTLTPGQQFTPYNQLTRDQVIGWINPQTIINCQDCVQGQIDSKYAPPVSPTNQPLPW